MDDTRAGDGPEHGQRLSLPQQISYAVGTFGVAFSPTVVSAWLGYFYYGRESGAGEPIILVPTVTFGTIWFLCNALNGITDPVVGYLSDRTRSAWGRRRPWVIFGAPLLGLSFFFLWTPATQGPSLANAAILAASLFGFWFFFTVVVAPYLSLLPEITPYNDERVRISAFMSAFEVVGTVMGNLLPPLMAAMLAGGFLFLRNGYQAMAFVGAVSLLLFFCASVLRIRETYAPPAAAGSAGSGTLRNALREFGSVFRNRPFIPYVVGVGFYRVAIATIVFLTPFISTKVLGAYPLSPAELRFLELLGAVGGEGGPDWELAAGYLMMIVLVGAACFFPLVSRLAGRMGKRAVYVLGLTGLGLILILMSTIGFWPLVPPLFQALVLFLLAAFPVAIALVVIRPMLADVIDADEKITNRRREGVYNGMEGLIMKVAAGIGPLAAGFVFSAFGSSTAHNLGVRICGPLAGVCLLAAALSFSRYPIRK